MVVDVLATPVSAQCGMGIGHHTLGKYRQFLRDFSHRSTSERKAATAEKRRLRIPTQIAVVFVVLLLGMLLAWSLFSTF